MSKDNGGPAFPRSESLYPDGTVSDPGAYGMTLRDYFAAKAMASFLIANPLQKSVCPMSDYAEDAYKIADAMLEARES